MGGISSRGWYRPDHSKTASDGPAYGIERAQSIECATIYRLARIVGIPRLRCAFHRLRKSIESAEHIYVYEMFYLLITCGAFYFPKLRG